MSSTLARVSSNIGPSAGSPSRSDSNAGPTVNRCVRASTGLSERRPGWLAAATVASAVILAACSSSTPVDPGETPTTVIDTTAAAPTGCSEQSAFDNPDTDYLIDVQFIDMPAPCLPADSTVQFTVYGYDRFVADVAATPILRTHRPALAPGQRYRLGFNQAALASVEYQSGGENALGYYLTVYVDTDNDGRPCAGDYQQHFDNTGPVFFSSDDTQASITINLVEITSTLCP